MKFAFLLVLLFSQLAGTFANAKEAIFIAIGAGAMINHEYNSYSQDLNKQGYKITIHSFDPSYGTGYKSSDPEMGAQICPPGFTDYSQCETVDSGLENERFSHINYTIYEDSRRDYVMKSRINPKNTVHLIRYASGVLTNNRNGKYVEKIIQDGLKSGKKVVFIDAVDCANLRMITRNLFKKYQNKISFVHALHNYAQVIDEELIGLTNDPKCFEGEFAHRCIFETATLHENVFKQSKKMQEITRKYDNFSDLSDAQKKEFITTATERQDTLNNKMQASASCINDRLHNSKYRDINSELMSEAS